MKASEHVPRALTIAGSDSGGGAGIQADLKTMHQHHVYGMSVITAVTAQNTVGVQGVHEIPPDFVRLQLQSIFDDLRPDAVKTGMLASTPIIRTVVEFLEQNPVQNLVVDPVMVAKGGHPLILDDAIQTVKERLLPVADVLTPNVPEAEVLCGFGLDTWASYHEAARILADMGVKTVVLKGGHMQRGVESGFIRELGNVLSFDNFGGDNPCDISVDLVLSSGKWTYFCTPRVESSKTHGTGCTFASAITSLLARGASPLRAIAGAKAFVYHAIADGRSWDVGAGHGPTNHFVSPAPDIENDSFEEGNVYVYTGMEWIDRDISPLS